MKIKTGDPHALWELYESGRTYNSQINLYNTVDINEAFYLGDQWHGLNAPDIDKPVFNQIRQTINYNVATIVSDDVSIALSPSIPSSEDERYLNCVAKEVDRVREQMDMETVNRESLRNAAVDGDTAIYLYWDNDIKTGQPTKGDIRCQLIENTNCIFGNPHDYRVQEQPYIIIVLRRFLEDVIDEAVQNGMSETDARDKIKADDDSNQGETYSSDTKLVTELITLYRKTAEEGAEPTIHAVISTQNVIIREEWDLKYGLYPVAWMNWLRSRRSYHGVSIVSEMIPAQIQLNKLIANYLRCTSMYAWQKVVYNRAKIRKWDNRIGVNIAVDGNPADAYAVLVPGAGASADVTNALEWIKSNIKESSGANDAALGQMKSDNTSAIIAMQEANTVPLDLQRRGYYSFQEQIVRIILDMLRVNAGTRYIGYDEEDYAGMQQPLIPDAGGMTGDMSQLPAELSSPVLDSADTIGTPTDIANAPEGTRPIDFAKLGDMAWKLKVDIGAGSYYSEAIRQRTLDNLRQMDVLDNVQYLERVSDKYIPDRETLIEEIKEQQAQAPALPPDGSFTGGGTTSDPYADEGFDDSVRSRQAKSYIQGLRQGL